MRKITLSAEEYSINDLSNVDQLVYDANGFPAASNFTKKSKGATLNHLNQSKTLIIRNNKLCWGSKTEKKAGNKAIKGGGHHKKNKPKRSKKKRSQKKSRSRSRSRVKSKSDNLLKMMMMQQMLTRGYKKNQDQAEENYLIQSGGSPQQRAISFKDTLRQYQDHLERMNDLSWDQLESSELEEIVEVQDHLKNTSLMLTKITEAFLSNLKKDVLDQATSIRNQVKSNKYGDKYNNQLRDERTKTKQFLSKYSTLNNLCQINDTKFDASAAFCKLYADVRHLSKETDQLAIQNDFNKNLTELKQFLSNKITLTPEEVTAKVNENKVLINQYPDDYLGASLIYQFQRTHKEIVDKETERFRQERLREDAERAKAKTSVTFESQPLNLVNPDLTIKKETVTVVEQPKPTGIMEAIFGPPQTSVPLAHPVSTAIPPAPPVSTAIPPAPPVSTPAPPAPPVSTPVPLAPRLEPNLTIEERLAKIENQLKQKKPEDLHLLGPNAISQQSKPENPYFLDPNAISPQQPNYY